ncbi:T9SS type A sorting domain-containing protein [Pontibacter sp. KCTC 32443]|uniref:T9SS type A sorting domain-containing protein n=1 Tax=Pontibacter TaxID=323449 RepID=UPI00164D3E48|nr:MULTISPECIES: T9SS type A sorting domain-containing protein [Pontibacter]MBC5774473.1 T9SS type A sorting domain-containing protein [Pontibacter sp. KCTC 32443]
MRIFTLSFKSLHWLLFFGLQFLFTAQTFAQTYWKGTASSDWGVGSNWSTGIAPGPSDEVIIGSTHFTGSYQPIMNETAVVTVRRLTLSNESGKNAKLLITNNYNLVITELLTIGLGTTLENEGSDMVVQGSIINNGTYLESEFIKNNGRKGRFYPSLEMSGTGTISGDVPMTISHLKITGAITLAQNLFIRTRNITVSGQNTQPTSDLIIVGTFDPGTKIVRFVGKGTSETTPSDGTNSLTVEGGGTLKVMASTYAENYSIQPTTIYTTSTVEYGSTIIDQDILPRAYGILKISGKDRTKKLIGTTTVANTDAATQLIVESGVLDLQAFTLSRTSGSTAVVGGTLTVANGAKLRIGGTGTFPTGYLTVNLGPTSTVDYYGSAQTVGTQTYGHLILSGTGIKTMPVSTTTALTVAGDFSSMGTVSYTAGSAITVLGNVDIGSGTTFGGSSQTVTVGGHWINNGTYTPGTSKVIMNGAGMEIRRTSSGSVSFYDLNVTTGQISTATGVDVEVFSNLATSGAGKFTSTSNLTMSGTGSISGEGITLQNLNGNGTTTTAAILTVNGNITVNSGKSLVATGGVINMMGSGVTINNSGTLQFFSLRVLGTATTTSNFNVFSNLSGTGMLTATAGTISFVESSTFGGAHMLYDVVVSSGKTLTPNANSILGIANTLTTTGAIFNVSANAPNTVIFNKVGDQNVSAREYYNLTVENTGTKTATGNLVVLGDLTLKAAFSAGSHTHSVRGTFDNQTGAGFAAGTGTIKFDGSGNSIVKGNNTVFNILEVNKSINSSYLQLSNSIQAKDLIVGTTTVAAGEIRTGTNVLTVTGSRTGMGWVYGTINRQHAFAANTAYVFAGPYNTITLPNTAGITSIAVTNTSGVINSFTNGSAINRRYDVSITGGSNYAGTMQLQYNDAELNGNSEAEIQLFKAASAAGPWEAANSTGRSDLQNWVTNNALTDVRGSWTLSASSGILRWVGATSTDWATASNWYSGNNPATEAPGAGDIVQFGGSGVVNQPTLTTTTTIKAIQFLDNGSSITLTLGQGSDLTVSGNIVANGSGSTSLTHSINLNSAVAKLKVNGSLTLSGGTNNNITLNSGAGSVAVSGNIEHDNSSAVVLGAGALNIGGDYNYIAGTFTAGVESNVNYNGTGSQIIAPHNYHHLTIGKASGVATLNAGAVIINGNFNLSGAAAVALSVSNLTINGNVNLNNGSLDAGASTISVAGNWTRTLGTFTPATSTVKFTGTTDASIGVVGGSETDYTFNKLIFEKTGSAVFTVNKNLRVNADLDITSGTVNLGLLTVVRTAPGGNFTMGSTGVLLLDNSNFPANFSNVSLSTASHVKYQGTITQNIAAVTYGNLTLDNGATISKNLLAATTVNGNITITDDATLNGVGQTLTLKGDFSLATGGQFIAGATYNQGTLVLSPIEANTKTAKYLRGVIVTNNMLLEPFADYTLSNDVSTNSLTVKGHFNNQGSINGTTLKATFESDFINTGVLKSSGVAAFTGSRQQTIQLLAPIQGYLTNPTTKGPVPPTVEFNGTVSPVLNSTADPVFGSVLITNTGGVRTSVNWTIYGELKVAGGAFHGGSYTHNIHTAITNAGVITSSGLINFEPLPMGQMSDGVAMQLFPFYMGADSTYFQSTGTLRIGGGLPITLAGVIPAKLNNVIFANTHAYGVRTYLYGASPVVLSSKIPPITGTKWRIGGNLRVEPNSSFTPGPGTSYIIGGNVTNSGTINGSNSDFTLTNSIGQANSPKTPAIISGIGTTTVGNLTIETGAAVEINNLVTVQKDFIYKGANLQVNEGTLRFAGANNGVITSTSGIVSIGNMEVAKDATAKLTLQAEILDIYNLQVLGGTLDLADKNVSKPAVLAGDVSQAEIKVADNAFLKIGGIGTTAQLQMDRYTFTENSMVEYYNPSTTPSASHKQVVLSEQYGNLKLSNLSTKEFATGHAKIAGELTIGAETVVVTPETIEYNGSGAQTVAALNYKNLTLSNAGVKTLAADITGVANALTKAGAAEFNAITNATTVNYNGATAQAVLPANYYNLDLSNTGAKSFSNITGVGNAFTVADGTSVDLTTAESTIDFNGSGAQVIPGRLEYSSLVVSGGNSKTLAADASIAKELKLTKGTIDTGSNIFTLAPTATISETEGNSVIGTVQTTRNMTTATEIFGGLGIEITAAVAPGDITVIRETGKPIISDITGNSSITRNFRFTTPASETGTDSETGAQGVANTDLNATVVFKYYKSELNGLEEGTLRLHNLVNGLKGEEWIKHSTAAPDLRTQSLTSTGINSLTRMTLVSTVKPFPVELLSFTAVKKGSDVVLKWATATEQNNKGFEVQVSADGYTYQTIGFVKSNVGSSATTQEYSFTDNRNGKNGMQYYRLKQIDLDGTSKIYGPRTVSFELLANAAQQALVYPNPFKENLAMSLSSPITGEAKVKLYTTTGKLLKEVQVQVQAGFNDQVLPIAQFAQEPGLYLLLIELDGKQQTIKLIKE